MAYDAGHYFKCPNIMCGAPTSKRTLNSFRYRGVFIPNRPATWELEDNYRDLESSIINTEYDQNFSIPSSVPELKCSYPRCIDQERGDTDKHIIKCGKCSINFAHKKCHLYFTNTKLKMKNNKRDLDGTKLPPYMCLECYQKTAISQI